MRDDVLPDLLKEVEENFTSEYGKSEEIRRAFDVLRAKKATYKNANDFAIEVGEVLSRALTGVVRADRLPDGKMYYNIAKRLLTPVLQRNYKLVADYSRNVQEHLNDVAKISLVAQPADLNQDRINGFIERFSKEEDFNNVSWLLGEPIVNFTQSVVDDSISKNVDLHAKSGLRPKIIRETDKKPCRWCVSLAGVYDYPRVPKDVYRRHQNCRCMVDYDPKNGKVQNVWTKKERVVSSDAIEKRKAFLVPQKYKIADKTAENRLLARSEKIWEKKLLGTEQNAIREYSNTKFMTINGYLGNRLSDEERKATTFYRIPQLVNDLDKVLSKNTLGEDLILHRAVSEKEFQDWLKGDLLKTYKSSSISDEIYNALGDGHKITIYAPKKTKGFYIGDYSSHPSEKEFLINRGQKYNILSHKDGVMEVEIIA